MDALYLVDGSGFIFRAYHALPPLTTKSGLPTGAIYGFAQMLIKLEQDHRPSHLAVVFDVSRTSFRTELYPEYKAQRAAMPDDLRVQLERVRDVVDAFRVPRIEQAGVEADDVIATLTHRARRQGLRVVIVSSDKDLMQLVDENVTLVDTMKKDEQRFGPAEVEAKFGVPPSKLGDLLALMGDSVDNVPGVPGVGPKTATALVRHFGSVAEILRRIDEIAGIPGLRGAAKVAGRRSRPGAQRPPCWNRAPPTAGARGSRGQSSRAPPEARVRGRASWRRHLQRPSRGDPE